MSEVINYSLYEFRNVQRYRIFKQNRIISISSRLIEFWCSALPATLGEGAGWMGWGVVGGGGWLRGAPHTCAHACACTHDHAHTCMHGKHDNSMQMAAPIGFGEIPGIPYDVIHACMSVHVRACACMCVHARACACVWGGPCHHPPPPSTHPPIPRGGPPESVKIQ